MDGDRPAGRHDVAIDAADLPGGLYFVRLSAGAVRGVRRFVIAK